MLIQDLFHPPLSFFQLFVLYCKLFMGDKTGHPLDEIPKMFLLTRSDCAGSVACCSCHMADLYSCAIQFASSVSIVVSTLNVFFVNEQPKVILLEE